MVSCIKHAPVSSGNSFECMVNGEYWKPQVPISNFFAGMFGAWTDPTIQCRYDEYNGISSVVIEANRYRQVDTLYKKSRIVIGIRNITQTGVYNLGQTTGATLSFSSENNCYLSVSDPGTTAGGAVIITTFDKTARIISGTFNLQIQNSCGTYNLTSGKFNATF